jgi:DNA-binding transcriptional MerR regulator
MDRVDEIKELMEAKKDEVVDFVEDTVEDIEAKLLERKAELEAELDAVKDTLGEKVSGAKAWIKSNKNLLITSGSTFLAGMIVARILISIG